MTSRRSWLLGLVLGTFITFQCVGYASAQINTGTSGIARSISYQGELSDNGAPLSGLHSFVVTYYNASGSALYTETFINQVVNNGLFSLQLGSLGLGFPPSMNFNEQYFVGISIDGAPELTPRTALAAAPYAMNAATVNGISASTTPTPGALLALDSTGHINPAAMPSTGAQVSSIDFVSPSPLTNDLEIVAGSNIQIVPNQPAHTLTINSLGSGIQGIVAGPGLTGGGDSGIVTISLGNSPIDGAQLIDGSVTGLKLVPSFAGDGLLRDGLGNLNVGVDNSTIATASGLLQIKAAGVTSREIANGAVSTTAIQDSAITSAKVNASSVQLRVIGSASPGSFIQSIGASGTIASGSVQTDGTLNRSVTGSDLTLGMNLGSTNTWSAVQTFNAGATISNLSIDSSLSVNVGTAGIVSFAGSRIQNVGLPTLSTDAATKGYIDSTFSNLTTLAGDVVGSASSNALNTSSPTTGNNVIAAANKGTGILNAVNVAQNLTMNGGSVNASPITNSTIDASTIGGTSAAGGTFTTLTTTDIHILGTSDFGSNIINHVGTPGVSTDAANKGYVDTKVSAISLAGDVTGAPGSNAIAATATSGNHVIAAANSGTGILNAANVAQDLTISGGKVDNSPIGFTTPSTGAFTTLAATGLTLSGAANMNSHLINNLTDPVSAQDAATKHYVDNSIGAISLAGDVTGAPGSNAIAATATSGNHVIAAANAGTGILKGANVAQNLTISGGTVDNSPVGFTTPSTGAFTTLAAAGLSLSGAANMNSHLINNLADPVAAQEAATKHYVDNTVGAITLAGDVTGAPGSNSIAATATSGNHVIAAANAGTGILNAANVAQDLTISGGTVDNSPVGFTTPSTGAFTTLAATGLSLSGAANMNSHLINNLADPVAAQDAATKHYVDNTVGSITLAGDVTGAPGSNAIAATATAGNHVIAAANSGTGILNAANVAQNLTISGGTVDNSPVGFTTPSTGAFTTLAATGLTLSGAANMNSNLINNLADPIAAQDAATKNYVDNTVGAITLAGDVTGAPGSNSISATAAAGNHIVAAANSGTAILNAANVAQNLTISGGTVDNTTVGFTTPSTGAFTTLAATGLTLSGAANMNSNLINNLADPVSAQDAATKNYVDDLTLNGDLTGIPGAAVISANVNSGNDIVGAINLASTGLNNTSINASFGTITGSTLNATTATSGITLGTGGSQTTLSSTATTGRTVSFPNASGTMPVMLATTATLNGTTSVVVSITGVVSTDHICVTRINPNASVTLGNITATAGAGSVTIVDDNAADVSTVDIIVFKK